MIQYFSLDLFEEMVSTAEGSTQVFVARKYLQRLPKCRSIAFVTSWEKMVLTFKGGTRVFVARIPTSVTDDDFGRIQ
ncbi:hypothetical protein CMV_020211 [Castanea mollissima]|uniref:Uncharacterized protein n=1 Tax=Castanea mollissima TaxID=60419 RepID=A0A8J4VLZ2_9ROSI|nr:hypothetical protein CMV_020211 [Castanea mollissima]